VNVNAFTSSIRSDHLVGFVRGPTGIVALRGDPYFFDTTRNSRCIAMIVPLEVVDVEEWTLAADACLLPEPLADVIGAGRMLLTSGRESSPFHVLMYPRADNMETSRGGVVLERKGDAFEPLLAEVDGVPYLIELKGCGCPIGGFGAYHLRRTTPKGCHFHLSGALGHAGARAEFEGLEARRTAARRLGHPLELRAVACARYRHPAARRDEELGQVVRLCPSSLRASFARNEVFDRLMSCDDATLALNLGREAACLLDLEVPRMHRNPSHNNLCYVAPGEYVLSDLEAAPPLSTGYEALDYDDSVVPDQYRHRARSVAGFGEFVEGMRSRTGAVRTILETHSPTDEAQLGRILYARLIGPRVWAARAGEDRDTREILARNFEHMRVFMPTAFFELPWTDWLEQRLIPALQEKLVVSDVYAEIAAESAWSAPTAGGSTRSHARLCEILRRHTDGARERMAERCAIHAYVPDRMFETLFVDAPTDQGAWEARRACIVDALSRARALAATGRHAPQPATTASSTAWSSVDLLFPYLEFVGTYLRNERRLVEGFAASPSYSGDDEAMVSAALAHVERLESLLHEAPERLHEFVRRGREAFVDRVHVPFSPSRGGATGA
jgi:hypothetical protein